MDREKKYGWVVRIILKMELEMKLTRDINFEYERKEFYKTRKSGENMVENKVNI